MIRNKQTTDFGPVKEARLIIEGNEAWRMLTNYGGKLVTAARTLGLYPLNLIPKYMSTSQIRVGQTSTTLTISIDVKSKIVLRHLPEIAKRVITSKLCF